MEERSRDDQRKSGAGICGLMRKETQVLTRDADVRAPTGARAAGVCACSIGEVGHGGLCRARVDWEAEDAHEVEREEMSSPRRFRALLLHTTLTWFLAAQMHVVVIGYKRATAPHDLVLALFSV